MTATLTSPQDDDNEDYSKDPDILEGVIADEEEDTTEFFTDEPLTFAKISKDLRAAVEHMSLDEIRFLNDVFYQYQLRRIATEGQMRALKQGADKAPENTPKPTLGVLQWLFGAEELLESQLEAILAFYAKRHPICQWMLNFKGVGGLIATGLVAQLRIEKAPAAGHFWNFAGLNPAVKWEKGQKRPWCGRLKTTCSKTRSEPLHSNITKADRTPDEEHHVS